MARKRSFEISAVNIVIHPHTPNLYADLFHALRRVRNPPRVHGEYHAYLGALRPLERGSPTKGLAGDIFKFFELDKEDAWLDVLEEKRADADAQERIQVPEDLKPHLGIFRYVFFPESHQLFYISHYREGGRSKSLSPGQVVKMIEKLSERQSIYERFGKVDATAIPSPESVEDILKIHRLNRLYIEIKRPNADEMDGLERRVMARLEDQKARKLVTELRAGRGESLEPDAETEGLARVAETNGEVIGEGYDSDDKKVVESTQERPLREAVEYLDGELEGEVFLSAAESLRAKLRAGRAARARRSRS